MISNDFYDKKLLVISLSPLVDEKQNATIENGFGRSFFQSKRISCIYIIPTWNHWYQFEYVKDALNIIKAMTSNFDKVVIYGVSMGAYAALKYADFLNATNVISISPQAVISAPYADFDNRFSQFWEKIEYKSDSWLQEKHPPIETTVFYDRLHDLDNRHAQLIARNMKHCQMVSLPLSGHEVFAVLNESGILSEFIFSLIYKTTPIAKLLRTYRQNRSKSGVPWMYAAQISMSRGRKLIAGRLYRRSIEVIESRKKNGLTIDQAKARMTVMEYVAFCFKTNDFTGFSKLYSAFSNNKIIKIDLSAKQLEYCLHVNDREQFIASLKHFKDTGRGHDATVNRLTAAAIRQGLVSETDLK
ncbi:hypothetical protein ABDX87_10440 [Pseudomonas abietaniphila]|uniref:hypothetical protein n=1 Tax=Pseudomonas abietaniphila TaxID=89065 RepID=UPI0032165F13